MNMNDDVKTGFDMPKPDTGIGTVSIGGDAKPMPEKKTDPIDEQWKQTSANPLNWDSSYNDD
tara:strand:- start:2544 stop:2729 length:186 start_codon:yes stop_codon:yes gene_type:complete